MSSRTCRRCMRYWPMKIKLFQTTSEGEAQTSFRAKVKRKKLGASVSKTLCWSLLFSQQAAPLYFFLLCKSLATTTGVLRQHCHMLCRSKHHVHSASMFHVVCFFSANQRCRSGVMVPTRTGPGQTSNGRHTTWPITTQIHLHLWHKKLRKLSAQSALSWSKSVSPSLVHVDHQNPLTAQVLLVN